MKETEEEKARQEALEIFRSKAEETLRTIKEDFKADVPETWLQKEKLKKLRELFAYSTASLRRFLEISQEFTAMANKVDLNAKLSDSYRQRYGTAEAEKERLEEASEAFLKLATGIVAGLR